MNSTEISAMWNFGEPRASEERFRDALANVDGDETRVELLTQIARAQGLQGEFESGHATLDEAALLPAASLSRIRALIAIERGRLFNSAGEPGSAVAYFETALEAATQSGDDALAIDAAHMLGIAAPPDARLAWNERALTMAERATDDRSRKWIGSLLNNIGWTYHDQGAYAVALDHFQRAALWQREQGEPGSIRIADWSVARALRSLHRFDDALAIQQRLASEWQAAGEADPYVDEEIGECLLALERPLDARPHFRKAYEGLSADSWLVKNEPARLERLKTLGSNDD